MRSARPSRRSCARYGPAAPRNLRRVTELLFSYGTLRQPEVQRTTFGRELDGPCRSIVVAVRLHVCVAATDAVRCSGRRNDDVIIDQCSYVVILLRSPCIVDALDEVRDRV